MNLRPVTFKPNRFVIASLAGRLSYRWLAVGASADISFTPAPPWRLEELFLEPVVVAAVKCPEKNFHCHFDVIYLM